MMSLREILHNICETDGVPAPKLKEHYRTPPMRELGETRVRKYEPGLRYRRWEIVDQFKMMTPTWQLLRPRIPHMPRESVVRRAFEIEAECDKLTITHREFELMIKVRLTIEFGI